MELSPKQLHYFKRELLRIQLRQELETFRRHLDLPSLLQGTDIVIDGDTQHNLQHDDVPFIRYMFQHAVIEFPLLKSDRQQEFWNKCQDFLNELYKVRLNTYAPSHAETSQGRVLLYKLEKVLLLALNVGIKTKQGQEESIKVTPKDLDDDNANLHGENVASALEKGPQRKITVDVVTVRVVEGQRAFLRGSNTHVEFIVKTMIEQENAEQTYFVAHRHGEFKQLHDKLRYCCPGTKIPMVPSKDTRSKKLGDMHREQDRILLRAYLRRIAKDRILCATDIFWDFLTKNPVILTDEEEEDAKRRAEFDRERVEQEIKFKKHVDEEVVALNDLMEMLKNRVMQPGGLMDMMAYIKSTETLGDLPESLRKAFEWGRTSFAYSLHNHFIVDDAGAENVASLKRLHNLIPYRVLAAILRYSNPMAMVKGIMDMFLAQPFGGRSLLQRVLLANMSTDVKTLQKGINDLEQSINDPILCQKVAIAVQTSDFETSAVDANYSEVPPAIEMLRLLCNEHFEPNITEQELQEKGLGKDLTKQGKRKLRDLYKLWTLRAKMHEQELLMSLVFQGVTGEIIKELFAIFYQPLAHVYKAADISESVHDFAAFMDDLINLLDTLDFANVHSNTIQPFIDLVKRHEDNFYRFVHRVHSQDSSRLFDELIEYIDNLLGSLTLGIYRGHPLDLDKTVEKAGLTPVDYPVLKAEIDSICEFRRLQKLRYLERTRKKAVAHKTHEQQNYEELYRLFPTNTEAIGIFKEIQEINEATSNHIDNQSSILAQDEEETDDEAYVDEEKPTQPKLKLIPQIAPFFVRDVTSLMECALAQKHKDAVDLS